MRMTHESHRQYRFAKLAALYRQKDPIFADWAAGYGAIQHEDRIQVRVYEMADLLAQRGVISKEEVYGCLAAADKITNAVMWLVVHMTYAKNVYLDGRHLEAGDFKPNPDGHTGGALNMVPAYVGYLAINAITNITRSWLMGQGHCVAAIDAANLVVNNMTPAQMNPKARQSLRFSAGSSAERYDLSDEGLTRFVRDFYSYAVRPDGRTESPLGSHVNAYTAGGLIEGGYLGFTELQYVHMPLPGERLVVFLSDGAFEEQRGSDWTPRWWRAEDSGLVAPIMIANGRRIDQRTTMSQQGGVLWFRDHLRLNGFEPIDIDGRDPAAFGWAVFEMEERLSEWSSALAAGQAQMNPKARQSLRFSAGSSYPIPLPYAIAEAPKGYGFPGEGTNLAHNLPLGTNPANDAVARGKFNSGARRLWVSLSELNEAATVLNNHEAQQRVKERDHALANRNVQLPELPRPTWRNPADGASASPMEGIDSHFCQIIEENPDLRPRVGNPDELRSNRMNATLDLLKHRVTAPESGVAESLDGAVITALNEEAVVCAALSNKGGINIVVTYEAFAGKMLGAIRQELIFTRHQREAGIDVGWLSVPDIFTQKQAQELVDNGAIRLRGDDDADEPAGGFIQALLVATGAYQLTEALRASDRLNERGIPHAVVYLLEPGRFRMPRDDREAEYTAKPSLRDSLFPPNVVVRVFLKDVTK